MTKFLTTCFCASPMNKVDIKDAYIGGGIAPCIEGISFSSMDDDLPQIIGLR